MRSRIVNGLVVVMLSAGLACNKHEDTQPLPDVSNVPKIELISVNPTTVQQLNDSVVFTIKYTDGDGDLGFESADSMSVELTDNRFPLTFHYHLQPLSPANASVAITGQLPIVLDNTLLQNDEDQAEKATFSIRLKDRAGNWSNTVTTTPITVTP